MVLALASGLTIVGLGLLGLTLSVPQSAEDFGFRGSTAISAISFSTVGWVIARRQPANALGWLFLGVGLISAVSVFCQGYAIYGVQAHPGALPWAVWAAWLFSWIWVPFATLVGVHTLLLFPDGRLLTPRWWAVAWLGAVLGATMSAAVALGPITPSCRAGSLQAMLFVPKYVGWRSVLLTRRRRLFLKTLSR